MSCVAGCHHFVIGAKILSLQFLETIKNIFFTFKKNILKNFRKISKNKTIIAANRCLNKTSEATFSICINLILYTHSNKLQMAFRIMNCTGSLV